MLLLRVEFDGMQSACEIPLGCESRALAELHPEVDRLV
jgi:hypothetical protein